MASHLQPLPEPWRGDIAAARPQRTMPAAAPERPPVVLERIEQGAPVQHPLAVYEQLLMQITQGATT